MSDSDEKIRKKYRARFSPSQRSIRGRQSETTDSRKYPRPQPVLALSRSGRFSPSLQNIGFFRFSSAWNRARRRAQQNPAGPVQFADIGD